MAAKAKGKKKDTSNEVWEDPEVLAQQISKTEKFFADNKGLVSIVLVVAFLIVGGFIGWRYMKNTNNQEAQSEMFQAVFYFEQDSLELALRGDGNNLGLVKIVEDYGNTEAGNLANFYTGAAYLRQEKIDLALLYLEDFSTDDLVLQARAYSLLGDIYMEKAEFQKAVEYYTNASNFKPNKEFTPVYLTKKAIGHEKLNDLESAKKAYKRIIDEFWDAQPYPEYTNAKKQYARLGGTES